MANNKNTPRIDREEGNASEFLLTFSSAFEHLFFSCFLLHLNISSSHVSFRIRTSLLLLTFGFRESFLPARHSRK